MTDEQTGSLDFVVRNAWCFGLIQLAEVLWWDLSHHVLSAIPPCKLKVRFLCFLQRNQPIPGYRLQDNVALHKISKELAQKTVQLPGDVSSALVQLAPNESC